MLIDNEGNYFGDKVVLDIIVESENDDAVILAEMMDNVDMSMKHGAIDFNDEEQRDVTRISMMHHKRPLPAAPP